MYFHFQEEKNFIGYKETALFAYLTARKTIQGMKKCGKLKSDGLVYHIFSFKGAEKYEIYEDAWVRQ